MGNGGQGSVKNPIPQYTPPSADETMATIYQQNVEWANDMITSMKSANSNGVFDKQIATMEAYKKDEEGKLEAEVDKVLGDKTPCTLHGEVQ
jgi:hypothetical protein